MIDPHLPKSRREFNCPFAFIDEPVKTQAGNRHVLIAASKRVALLLQHPFGEAVRVFGIGGMVFVQWEIVKLWGAAKGTADGIDG